MACNGGISAYLPLPITVLLMDDYQEDSQPMAWTAHSVRMATTHRDERGGLTADKGGQSRPSVNTNSKGLDQMKQALPA